MADKGRRGIRRQIAFDTLRRRRQRYGSGRWPSLDDLVETIRRADAFGWPKALEWLSSKTRRESWSHSSVKCEIKEPCGLEPREFREEIAVRARAFLTPARLNRVGAWIFENGVDRCRISLAHHRGVPPDTLIARTLTADAMGHLDSEKRDQAPACHCIRFYADAGYHALALIDGADAFSIHASPVAVHAGESSGPETRALPVQSRRRAQRAASPDRPSAHG